MWWLPIASASSFMPPKGTAIADQVDQIYAFLLIASLISFILLIGGMIYFVIKYKRSSENQKSAYITHNHMLEFLWSFIPFVIFIFVFVWGWIVYHDMRSFPADSLEVHVSAKKWAWKFTYKNGKEAIAMPDAEGNIVPPTMVVPINRPVKLIMYSEKINPAGNDPSDKAVIHSFFVPAFRIKQDIVPGRYTALGFNADKLGEFQVFCTEFCGTGHSDMRAIVKVVSNEEFEAWLAGEAVQTASAGGAPALSPMAEKGRSLYMSKACIGCHSLNGSPMTGPTWKGFFGSQRVLADGKTVTADENYIRDSILNPNAQIVKGFQPNQMPTFQGQLSDEDIMSIIEFIKTVK